MIIREVKKIEIMIPLQLAVKLFFKANVPMSYNDAIINNSYFKKIKQNLCLNFLLQHSRNCASNNKYYCKYYPLLK